LDQRVKAAIDEGVGKDFSALTRAALVEVPGPTRAPGQRLTSPSDIDLGKQRYKQMKELIRAREAP